MLKGNLSTRPFYNESLVNILLVLAAAVGLAVAAFNVTKGVALWSERERLTHLSDAAIASAKTITAAAERQKGSVDRDTLLNLGASTLEANSIIDERTFSWSVFFGLMEKTLPNDARLIAVAPRDERGVFVINMIVNPKRLDELSEFMDALGATGSFYDLIAADEQVNDDGTFNATVTGKYIAPQAPKPPAPAKGKGTGTPAPGGRP